MPVSKNRKNHVQKAKYRNTKLKEQKNRIDNMYNSMLAELRDKNTSMTEMLNKEDEVGKLPNSPEQTYIE